MASEQSGKSTSSNSDDNFSLPSSKLAGDSNSLSSDIVGDHENTIIENKCDNDKIDVGDGCFDDHDIDGDHEDTINGNKSENDDIDVSDGCFDDHDITSDNVEKDKEYQESLPDNSKSEQHEYELNNDDLSNYLEEDFLRMIEPDESRFDIKNTSRVPLNEQICTLVSETQKFSSFELHSAIMYNGKFGIVFGDYIENVGLFYCTSAPINGQLKDDDILMHFLSLDFRKAKAISVHKFLLSDNYLQPEKTFNEDHPQYSKFKGSQVMKKHLAQYVEVKKQLRHRNQVNYKGTGNKSSDKIENDMSGKKRSYTKKDLSSNDRKDKSSKATRSSTPRVAAKTTIPKSSRKKPIDLTKSDVDVLTKGFNQISADRYHNSYGATTAPVYYSYNNVQQSQDDYATKQIKTINDEIQLKEAKLKLLTLNSSIELHEKENMFRLKKQEEDITNASKLRAKELEVELMQLQNRARVQEQEEFAKVKAIKLAAFRTELVTRQIEERESAYYNNAADIESQIRVLQMESERELRAISNRSALEKAKNEAMDGKIQALQSSKTWKTARAEKEALLRELESI